MQFSAIGREEKAGSAENRQLRPPPLNISLNNYPQHFSLMDHVSNYTHYLHRDTYLRTEQTGKIEAVLNPAY